jgi:hypothetical protein
MNLVLSENQIPPYLTIMDVVLYLTEHRITFFCEIDDKGTYHIEICNFDVAALRYFGEFLSKQRERVKHHEQML